VVSAVRVISDPEGARERLVGRVIIEYTVLDAGEESADLDSRSGSSETTS
jgi:hypothetical protein